MEKKLRIVADSGIPFLKGVLEPFAEVLYLPGKEISPQSIREADALFVRTRTRCDASLLENSSVRFLATATIGIDHLDSHYLNEKNIFWTNAPACNADSVCQYITSALLEICAQTQTDFSSLTLGIVGVGNIGKRVKARAECLGIKTICSDPPRALSEGFSESVSLEEVYSNANVVTFHVPLVSKGDFPTYHLLNDSSARFLKHGAWIINASRGGVVDEACLFRLLDDQLCRGAILDCFESEPQISSTLLDKVSFATPHIAGYSRDGKANATASIVRAFAKFFGIDELKNFTASPKEISSIATIEFPPNLSEVEQLKRLFSLSYDISQDDSSLRESPEKFESLRTNYPPRREPKAYTVRLLGASPRVLSWGKSFGFHLV